MGLTLPEAMAEMRNRAGLSQSALARRLGSAAATVSLREAGRRDIDGSTISRLSAETGLCLIATPDGWIVREPGDPFVTNEERTDRYLEEGPGEGLPVLSQAGAGPPTFAPERVEEWFDLRRRWLHRIDGVIEVHGNSMEPLLRDGDLVGVRLFGESEYPRLGEVVVAWRPLDGDVLVKAYGGEDEDGRIILLSVNIAHPQIVVKPEDIILKGWAFGLVRVERFRLGLTEYHGWP